MQKNVFEYLPITFVIDNSDKMLFDSAFSFFNLYFNVIEKNKQS